MVLYWNFSDSKSPQFSTTLLSILININNAVDLTVSLRPIISKFSSPCINPLVTVPRAPITTFTFTFHSFRNALTISKYWSFFSLSLNFTLWSNGTAKSKILPDLSSLLIIIWAGRQANIRWSVCISKSQRSLFCVVYIPLVSHRQTSLPYSIPSRSPCPPSMPCLKLFML